MRGLLIAEKPSVMRAIQAEYKKGRYPYTLDFMAFHGHLMGLKEPAEIRADWGSPWRAEQLPMIPDRFEYKTVDQKSADTIAEAIRGGNYDFVVNACDAGREGEHIFWSFYETYGFTVPVKRYWANSNAPAAISGALAGLYPAEHFDGMRQAAKLRAQLDWLVGMNFSRAVTLAMNRNTAIGRVQTPTLKMVVDRELEIRNFRAEPFWELKASFQTEGGDRFDAVCLAAPDFKTSRYTDKDAAEAVRRSLGREGTVVRVKQERKETKPPTLFSTTELQKAANKAFQMKPAAVDSVAQELYEAGYITYPRTQSRYLPTQLVPELPKHLAALAGVPVVGPYAAKVSRAEIERATAGKTYVDDGRIEDHHAIIPTETPVLWDRLTARQRDIYLLIAKRFVSIFLPPFVTLKTSVLVRAGKPLFRADGTVLLDRGYAALYDAKADDVLLPKLAEGQRVTLDRTELRESATKPPPRYTPSTLLAAMESAGKMVPEANYRMILREAAGLGTPATRSGILSEMVTRGYLTLEKNQYAPSEYAIELIARYQDRDFTSPVLTAVWEEKLQGLEKGTCSGDIRAEIEAYIRREVRSLLGGAAGARRYPAVGRCPLCGGSVLKKKAFYVCERYKADTDPCTFCIPQELAGTAVTEEDLALLLSGSPAGPKTLTLKDGFRVRRLLVLDSRGRLDLQKTPESTRDLGACPLCLKGIIHEGPNYYLCSRKDEGCPFVQSKVVLGAEITPDDMEALLQGRPSGKKEFTWKSGKKGWARLQLKPDGTIGFVFD